MHHGAGVQQSVFRTGHKSKRQWQKRFSLPPLPRPGLLLQQPKPVMPHCRAVCVPPQHPTKGWQHSTVRLVLDRTSVSAASPAGDLTTRLQIKVSKPWLVHRSKAKHLIWVRGNQICGPPGPGPCLLQDPANVGPDGNKEGDTLLCGVRSATRCCTTGPAQRCASGAAPAMCPSSKSVEGAGKPAGGSPASQHKKHLC